MKMKVNAFDKATWIILLIAAIYIVVQVLRAIL
jgi:hypothetical protein